MLVTLNEVLNKAQRQKYAVAAFNIISPLAITPLIRAAEQQRSPVILSLAEVHFKDCEVEEIYPNVLHAAKKAKVPVVVHLDHGTSDYAVMTAIKSGFSSIMYDASAKDFESNKKSTALVSKFCHSIGLSVEGELGSIGGTGSAEGGETNRNQFTPKDKVIEFVSETQIDAFAISIGNVHGFYKGEPNLQFDLLSDIAKMTKLPLVLHGGSGISDKDFQKAISLGICKINFYTGISFAVFNELNSFMKKQDGHYIDMAKICWNMMNTIQSIAEERLIVFGSSGKA